MRWGAGLALALAGAAIATGCYGCPIGARTQEPIAPPREPRPLTELNSVHDDYNAAAPFAMESGELIFSSNRGSQAAHFDLYRAHVTIMRDTIVPRSGGPEPWLPQAMSPADELGPSVVRFGPPRLVFASNRSGGAGGLDLWWYPLSTEHPPLPVAELNTPADDAYWTWIEGSREVYFASNRDGNWDIYAASPALPVESGAARIRRVNELCSAADDTAPFLFESGEPPARHVYLLFASRRGGPSFDLYCARREGERFSQPQPLSVNTGYREFRPITLLDGRALVFSSDRPGGKGGMDLWYAALSNPCAP